MSQNKPLRILYGITKSNFGGAQRYVFDLATAAKKAGHTVAVLAGGRGTLTHKLEKEGIEVISLERMGRDISVFDDAQSFFTIMNVLDKWKPDVFHINSSKMGGVGGLAARIQKVPKIIFTAHGWAFNEDRPPYQKWVIKFLHWITILLSHKTIAVSLKTKKDFETWPLVKNNISVVHNGISNFHLVSRSESRKKLWPGISDKTLLVGTIAELHRVKGLDTLLLAWSKFAKNRDTKLVIMGRGDEEDNLRFLIEDLEISDSVSLLGYVENAKQYLSGLDIFVLPSLSEGLPYAVLEAGVAHLATVSSRVGGIPEIIDDSDNGLLVPPADAEWLERALTHLANDARLRQKLADNLKSTVREKFSLEKMVKETLSLY